MIAFFIYSYKLKFGWQIVLVYHFRVPSMVVVE